MYVEKLKTHSWRLYITNISKADFGGYTCKANVYIDQDPLVESVALVTAGSKEQIIAYVLAKDRPYFS